MVLIKKSILASILIGLGVAVSLTLGNPLGAIFFAFGLLGICLLQANLFTGKCGYWWKDQFWHLMLVLLINLAAGYLIGILLGLASPGLVQVAILKVAEWTFSLEFFVRAIFCGMVMYICVELYNRGDKAGIFLGIPLFIFCGFQHCIANIIVLGVAHSFSWTILLAILGNLIGSMIINILSNP